ncbi:uncharacterized protein J3R85_018106 [Psidium guajava]|nr:uncharacterized protein J3R85_018106 [Psidium guajava]
MRIGGSVTTKKLISIAIDSEVSVKAESVELSLQDLSPRCATVLRAPYVLLPLLVDPPSERGEGDHGDHGYSDPRLLAAAHPAGRSSVVGLLVGRDRPARGAARRGSGDRRLPRRRRTRRPRRGGGSEDHRGRRRRGGGRSERRVSGGGGLGRGREVGGGGMRGGSRGEESGVGGEGEWEEERESESENAEAGHEDEGGKPLVTQREMQIWGS